MVRNSCQRLDKNFNPEDVPPETSLELENTVSALSLSLSLSLSRYNRILPRNVAVKSGEIQRETLLRELEEEFSPSSPESQLPQTRNEHGKRSFIYYHHRGGKRFEDELPREQCTRRGKQLNHRSLLDSIDYVNNKNSSTSLVNALFLAILSYR